MDIKRPTPTDTLARFLLANGQTGFEHCQGYRTMKARESALKLKRFEADEKGRKVQDLEQMIREFETMASDLERQVQAEEERTGIKDQAHFAYSTFAKSAAQRRNNLIASTGELVQRLEAARREHEEALAQLARFVAADVRHDQPNRRRPDGMRGVVLR